MAKSKHKPAAAPMTTPSAMQRRLRYGLNVSVAVFAAVGICVLLNWLVYRQYRAMSPDSRRLVRYDMTSTRRYSLSPQTRGVLKSLDDRHRVVTMLGGTDDDDTTQVQEVRDLVDEYARASALVDQTHLDLASDAEARSALLGELAALYADDTRDVRGVVSDGFDVLEGPGDGSGHGLINDLMTIQQMLQEVIDTQAVTGVGDVQLLYQLKSQHDLAQEEYNRILELRHEELGAGWRNRLSEDGLVAEGPDAGADLPDYVLLLAHMQRWQLAVQQELLATTYNAVQQLSGRLRSRRVDSPEVRNRTLDARDKLAGIERLIREPGVSGKSLFENATDAANRLQVRADQVPREYDDARAVLSSQPCVVVMSGTQARVVPSALMYRGVQGIETAASDSRAQEQFLGEEQLTGALVSLSLSPPPRVIFVRSNTGRRALSVGAGAERTLGDYSHVAQRLRAIGIEVAEWVYDPSPSKAPTRRPGQRVVWVVLPYAKPMPEHPQTMDQTLKTSVVAYVQERLETGDSAMFLLGPNTFADPERREEILASAGAQNAGLADDPLLGLLSLWGIDAQVYQNVFRVSQEDTEGRPIAPAGYSFTVTRWPDAGVLGQSLDGIPTYFGQAYPLELSATDGVTHTPLVELDDPAMWLQKPPGPRAVRGQPLDIPDDASVDRVLIGVAAERGASRLVVVGDPSWASDGVTTLGVTPDGRSTPRLADQPGAYILYPGNSELFVNSVFWLTENEELIAASPRTQDIRRLPAMSDGTVRTYKLLLLVVMPLGVFVIGGGVWLARRRA